MLTLLIAVAAAAPEEPPALRQGLEPLAFLVGHCWRGTFEGGAQDTHCFDSVYDGQHVRDRHEVTGGRAVYRGETIYSADSGAVSYTYWNSQGGVSRGTMRAEAGRLDFGDESYRGPDGRQVAISTHWRRVGDDAYEAVTSSSQSPSMNRTVRYQRVSDGDISISTFRGPDGSHTLVHELVVEAPAAEVWTAISTAEGWRAWAVPVAWDSEPDIIETSYTATARPGDPSTIRQRVLARIPGRMIVFRTIKAPARFPNFDSFRQTTIVIELEPIGGNRTRVRLTGAGYPDTDAGRQLLGFFREGNRATLERLRRRFVSGPIDWTIER